MPRLTPSEQNGLSKSGHTQWVQCRKGPQRPDPINGAIWKEMPLQFSPSAVSLSHTNTYRGTRMVTHSQADGGLVFMWHVANSQQQYCSTHTHTYILYSYSFCCIANRQVDSYMFAYNRLLCLLCWQRLRLFDQNTVRQYYWEILLQIKITLFLFWYIFKM